MRNKNIVPAYLLLETLHKGSLSKFLLQTIPLFQPPSIYPI